MFEWLWQKNKQNKYYLQFKKKKVAGHYWLTYREFLDRDQAIRVAETILNNQKKFLTFELKMRIVDDQNVVCWTNLK